MSKHLLLTAGLLAVACTGCATGFTGDERSVSGTKARVTGLVVSSVGGPIEYWVEYGPTTGYGSESAHLTAVGEEFEARPVTVDLTGLQRSTTYHYRLCASDSDEANPPGCGEDRTFRTTNLACGDVITTDFALDGTTTCESEAVGVVIGADGVDFNLNGHELFGPTGRAPEQTTGIGIDNTAGHDDVTIRNGWVRRFGTAIRLSGASFNVLRGVTIGDGNAGVVIQGGEANTIRDASVVPALGLGLRAEGSDRLVVSSSFVVLVSLSGDDAQILQSTIGGIGTSRPCLAISGNGNEIAENGLQDCRGGGIVVGAGANTEVIGNGIGSWPIDPPVPVDEADGIRVQPFTAGTLLQGNRVFAFGDDGIDVRAPATRLVGNDAHDNVDLGIDAVPGVTDGGGNTATGNGNAQQCRNVSCP